MIEACLSIKIIAFTAQISVIANLVKKYFFFSYFLFFFLLFLLISSTSSIHDDYDAYYVSFHFNAAIDRFTIIFIFLWIKFIDSDSESWVLVYGEFIPHRQCDLDMFCSYHWYDLMWDWEIIIEMLCKIWSNFCWKI